MQMVHEYQGLQHGPSRVVQVGWGYSKRPTIPGRKGESRKTSAWSSPKGHPSGQDVVPRDQVSGRWPTWLRGACVQEWKGSSRDDVDQRRRLPRNCEGRREGGGKRKARGLEYPALTWWDSGSFLKAKAERSGGNFCAAGLRERGGQRAGVSTGEAQGRQASFPDTPSRAARDSSLLRTPIATTK